MYLMYLGKTESVIYDCDDDGVLTVADFNAAINKFYYQELSHLCNALDLVISDVSLLLDDTHTHTHERYMRIHTYTQVSSTVICPLLFKSI